MKRKLLSPLELKEFRLQQEEQKRIRAEQLAKKNKKLTSPKELLDPKPVVEVKEEPVVVEEPKDPIEIDYQLARAVDLLRGLSVFNALSSKS